MKIQRYGRLAGLTLAGALAVTACGSNNNSPSSSGTGSTGGTTGSAAAISCASGTLNAAGSTAQSNAIQQFAKNYETQCGSANINYSPTGSGAGVTSFTNGQVDFAGSDFALNAQQQQAAAAHCKNNPALDLPMVPGAIAAGYNVTDSSGKQIAGLKLSASTLAKIFSGKITSWDDPAIKAENPTASLPSEKIQVFVRGDASGTSYNFSNYLTHDAPADWTFGANKQWPAPGGTGESGSQNVAQKVSSTAGGIGYFELSFASAPNISVATVGDSANNFIAPSVAAATEFLSHATVAGQGNDLALNFDYSAASASPTSYPASLVTYEIVCSQGNDAGKLPLIKSFLTYMDSSAAQQSLPSIGYVSLPANIQAKVSAAINTVG